MYKIKPQILQTPVADGNILLLEPEQGHYFELNEISVLIFQGIQSQLSQSEIIENIIMSYDVDIKSAEKDMMELIEKLLNNKIIELVD